MGKSEAVMSAKSDKVSSSSKAYYGSGVPVLAPYFNSSVMGGQVPYPFVWAPSQPLIPPYGVPCAAIYSHRGVHAHPAVPLVATPLSKKVHSKASVDMDQGVTKKFKRLDGLAVPVGNGSTEDVAGGSVYELSQSFVGLKPSLLLFIFLEANCPNQVNFKMMENSLHASCSCVKYGVDGSTDGSDENTGRYSSSEGILSSDHDGNFHRLAVTLSEGEAYAATRKVSMNTVTPTDVARNSVRPLNRNAQTHASCVASSSSAGLPFEVCLQDEQQLKRVRRKQANRESAKRSRFRKQAETEELISRYETLKEENKALKFEISRLTEHLDKVRQENTALQENLKNKRQLGLQDEMAPCKNDVDLTLPNKFEEVDKPNDSNSLNQNMQIEC